MEVHDVGQTSRKPNIVNENLITAIQALLEGDR